jgi:prepilin-type processing-associated H-X9-DG protein
MENRNQFPTNGVEKASDTEKVASPPSKRWPLKVAPYMGAGPQLSDPGFQSQDLYGTNLYRCPVHDNDAATLGAQGTYGLNDNLMLELHPVHQLAVGRLAEFPVLADSGASGGLRMDTKYPHEDAKNYGWTGAPSKSGPAPNHNGKCHFLFADGHVELRGISNPNQWPWQNPAIFSP